MQRLPSAGTAILGVVCFCLLFQSLSFAEKPELIGQTGHSGIVNDVCFRELGHGIFTHAFLKGLQGEADARARSDGKVTVRELMAHIEDTIPELTREHHGTAQYPNGYARGQDFPLGATNP